MSRRVAVVLSLAALLLGGLAAPAGAADPTPGPTITCPPALPISGVVSATTEHSLTISYYMLMTPPCGYNAPITVTLFASAADAQQWANPVAEAVSGLERSGAVTLTGLTPDTPYWYRFSADGKHDPYVIGTARTAAGAVCAATVAVNSAWTGGYVATVTVRNVSAQALDTWQVSWQWPGDERITSVWNGVAAGDSTVRNASWNGTVTAGGTTTFGLLVTTGGTPATVPLTCSR
jgi:phosphodiesterase/alkaline phosphatase D-like protein